MVEGEKRELEKERGEGEGGRKKQSHPFFMSSTAFWFFGSLKDRKVPFSPI